MVSRSTFFLINKVGNVNQRHLKESFAYLKLKKVNMVVSLLTCVLEGNFVKHYNGFETGNNSSLCGMLRILWKKRTHIQRYYII